MKLLIIIIMFGFTSLVELENLQELETHWRDGLAASDSLSTPFKRITRLFHKHGKSRKHVSVVKENVNANANDKSKEAHLVIESDSFGTIKIHSYATPTYYLCIGNDFKPTGISKKDLDEGRRDYTDCIFKEEFTDKYVQFKSTKFFSEKNNTGCLAFNRHGKGRKINRSRCGHKSTLFMERKSRIIIDIYKNGKFKNKLFSLLRSKQIKAT